MTVKHLTWALALGAAFWPGVANASGVKIQQFDSPETKSVDFVRGPAAQPGNSAAAPTDQALDLVAEFAAISEGAPGKISSPAARPIHIPALTQRHARPAPADGKTIATNWHAWPVPLNCATEEYTPNPALSPLSEQHRATWYLAMENAACEAGVPVNLLDALLIQESRYNPIAISPKGASGIAQLMPDRARQLGVRNVWDPVENMRGGARYLRVLLNEFGRFDLALAAYNAGEGRVRSAGGLPRIRETVNYVATILMTMRDQFTRQLNSGGGSAQRETAEMGGATTQQF